MLYVLDVLSCQGRVVMLWWPFVSCGASCHESGAVPAFICEGQLIALRVALRRAAKFLGKASCSRVLLRLAAATIICAPINQLAAAVVHPAHGQGVADGGGILTCEADTDLGLCSA